MIITKKGTTRTAYKRRSTEEETQRTILDETTRKYIYIQSTATLYNYLEGLDSQYLPKQGQLREFCNIVFILCGQYLQRECPKAMSIKTLPKRQSQTYETPLKAITLEEIELFLKEKQKDT